MLQTLVLVLLSDAAVGFCIWPLSAPKLGGRIQSRLYSSNDGSSEVPGPDKNTSSTPMLFGGEQGSIGGNPSTLRYEFEQSQKNIARIPTRPEDLLQESAPRKLTYSNSKLTSSDNKFFKVVEKLAPNELLMKFSNTAPKPVQEAVKGTIANLLGSIPQYSLDMALVTTSSKLASLMFQMQMTGYMFKNAEYRMSFTRSLKGLPKQVPAQQRPSDVDAQANELTAILSKEIEELRSELMLVREQRETELRSNMLTYIQALPEQEMQRLTADMTTDVMDAIHLLVDALMERLGIDMTGPELMVQQPVGALAQLCMWQIVVGYKLREMEAFEKGVALD